MAHREREFHGRPTPERAQGLALSWRLRVFLRLLVEDHATFLQTGGVDKLIDGPFGELEAGKLPAAWEAARAGADPLTANDFEFWNAQARFGFTALLGPCWGEDLREAQDSGDVLAGDVTEEVISELRARITSENRLFELLDVAIARASRDPDIHPDSVAVLAEERSAIHSFADVEGWMVSGGHNEKGEEICSAADVERNVLSTLFDLTGKRTSAGALGESTKGVVGGTQARGSCGGGVQAPMQDVWPTTAMLSKRDVPLSAVAAVVAPRCPCCDEEANVVHPAEVWLL